MDPGGGGGLEPSPPLTCKFWLQVRDVSFCTFEFGPVRVKDQKQARTRKFSSPIGWQQARTSQGQDFLVLVPSTNRTRLLTVSVEAGAAWNPLLTRSGQNLHQKFPVPQDPSSHACYFRGAWSLHCRSETPVRTPTIVTGSQQPGSGTSG